MEQNIEEINQVIQVLQQLNIPASVDNMSKLLYCMQLLNGVKGRLANIETTEVDQNATDGNE